ncbi:nuclear transport factor 2 family protein [uncultured Psychroserpens sp.]|uniref:nuclear transport factor 2 family protein n=1 Tax=uncultured Psychroserpens sp. TaxID=255436 RepID=UPI00260D5A3F|nr:nuclear transport factor 2 family protein [uncultured Psychroserpens sp.]
MKPPVYFILFLVTSTFFSYSQTNENSELYKTLKANDSLLFERSFNKCETQYLELLIAEDFEFYHDISGVDNSKKQFITTMKKGICNPNNTTKSRRELVEGSLEVFPLKNNGQLYGALQNGVHKFFETTNGKEVAGSIARFSHLWVLENEKWVLKRVISFDHKMQHKDKIIELPQNTLETYTGKYIADVTGEVFVSKITNGLHIKAGPMEADIYPITQTLFSHKKASLTFEFIINTNDNSSKMVVRENEKIVEEAIKQ